MSPDPERPATRTWALVALAAILATGAALRVIGLDYGLPAVYNQDEVSIVSRALAFAKGDPNPHNFLYPTFFFYVLFGWVGGYFALAQLLGWTASLQDFQTQFFVDPSGVYLAGRSLVAVCGVLGVLATYRMGRLVGGRVAGLAAALFLSVAPFHVRDSHYVKHDVPVTLLIVLAATAIIRLLDEPGGSRSRRTRILAAGAIGGAAIATHYYALLIAAPLAIAIMSARTGARTAAREAAVAAATAAATFTLLSPFVVLEPAAAIRDIIANRHIVMDRAVQTGGGLFASLPAYGKMLWNDAAGWPVAFLALAGLPLMLRQSVRRAAVFIAFPVAFFLFISNTVPATRYLNPLLPFLAVSAGLAVSAIAARAGSWQAASALALSLVSVVPAVQASIVIDRFFRLTDTRTLALRYVEQHVPPGSAVAIQPYSVPLTQSREGLVEALRANLGDERRASTREQLRLALDPYPSPAYRTIFLGDGGLDPDKIYVGYAAFEQPRGLAALRDLGVTWVIVKRYNTPAPDTRPFLSALEGEGHLVASFTPYRAMGLPVSGTWPEPYLHNTDARISAELERPGPLIEIWRLPSQRF